MQLPIEQIVVSAERHRKQLGDIKALAASIADIGLLHPPVVTADFRLVAGGRRLAAVKLLSWKKVSVTVVADLADAATQLRAERDENTCRLELLPSEAVSIGRELERLERETAKQRQQVGGKFKASGKLPEALKGDARDKVGQSVGYSGRSYEKAKAVVEAATVAPQKYGPLLEEMDRTRKVDRAFRQLRDAQELEAARVAAPALPDDERIQLHLGDFVDVCSKLPDHSIDAIVTDPPYPREFLPVYGQLAQVAARLLKPGGSLLVMVGQSYLPDILAAMTPHVNYRWTLAYLTPGGQAPQMWDRKVNTFWKPVLWFVAGSYERDWVGDVVQSAVNDNDKRFHEWGQSESGMIRLVERFTRPGDAILDPFLGGGTTGVAAVRLFRTFIGVDCDQKTLEAARARIAIAAQETTHVAA